MEQKEKMIIDELKEENRLLKLKVSAYKEELESLSNKLEYSEKFISLYESIIDASREEIKQLSMAIKKAEKNSSKNDTKSKVVKKIANTKKAIKKQVKKAVKKSKK